MNLLSSHSYLYHPSGIVRSHHIKITYIVTSRNITSFSDSNAMAFMNFLKTYTVSVYLKTPVGTEALYDHYFYSGPMTTVLRLTLQHILQFTHP